MSQVQKLNVLVLGQRSDSQLEAEATDTVEKEIFFFAKTRVLNMDS